MLRLSAWLFLALACAIPQAFADEEASNRPYVTTDRWGQCYARSVPAEFYGMKGETVVYAVGSGGDAEVARFDWFAPQIHLDCNVSNGAGVVAPALVAIGPWPRGHRPDDETLALAIYYDGEEKARFSTLDVAGRVPANASCSVSHYTVIDSVEGFAADAPKFSVTTVDGRRLTFDVTTGVMKEAGPASPPAPRGECF